MTNHKEKEKTEENGLGTDCWSVAEAGWSGFSGSHLRIQRHFLECRMTDDRLKRACANFAVIGDRNREGRIIELLWHDDVAATLPDFTETMHNQNGANLPARQNPQLTQP
ncbi:MAG TPA: hypothetical protein PKM19_07240 [Pseudomonadales bacterium]|nr:hypothetical protein [Pseudomonadales bacterium]